jgi:hypothetical protein
MNLIEKLISSDDDDDNIKKHRDNWHKTAG